jgi:hypothetical protein
MGADEKAGVGRSQADTLTSHLEKVKEYDDGLLEEIERIRGSIAEEEEIERGIMRNSGMTDKQIEVVFNDAHGTGKYLPQGGSISFRVVEALEALPAIYEAYPFRMYINRFSPVLRVIQGGEDLCFDIRPLTAAELHKYRTHVSSLMRINRKLHRFGVWRLYPTKDHMDFVAGLLDKYKDSGVSLSSKEETSQAEGINTALCPVLIPLHQRNLMSDY